MRQHWPTTEPAPGQTRLVGREFGAYLLHYFDLGFESWRTKMAWRSQSRGFRPRIKGNLARISQETDPEAGYRALYRTLHHFDDDRLARLKQQNAHFYVNLRLDALVAKHFPEQGS